MCNRPSKGPVLNPQAASSWLITVAMTCDYGDGIFSCPLWWVALTRWLTSCWWWCQRLKDCEFAARIWQHKLACEITVYFGIPCACGYLIWKNVCMYIVFEYMQINVWKWTNRIDRFGIERNWDIQYPTFSNVSRSTMLSVSKSHGVMPSCRTF